MTMPWGATEEPNVEFAMEQSVAPIVVSSGAKSGKSLAAEFARWRTTIVSSALGADSATPGAKRLLNRNQRRHRAHIFIIPSIVAQPVTDGIILGGREEICAGVPAVIGSLAGFLPVGISVRWEGQGELWVCFPASNANPVIVTTCDEIYASG